jgi:hypothetical protein
MSNARRSRRLRRDQPPRDTRLRVVMAGITDALEHLPEDVRQSALSGILDVLYNHVPEDAQLVYLNAYDEAMQKRESR